MLVTYAAIGLKKNVKEPVNYSTWVFPVAIVKKTNGYIWICSVYSTSLNDYLDTHQ